MKAIITVAMEAILESNEFDWKNMPRFITPKSKRGMKIVAKIS
jgi:hypothetical protein